MIDEDAVAVCGKKKRYGLLPRQGRLVIEFLSVQGGEWKESQVMSNLRESWGRDGIDRGKITFSVVVQRIQTGSTSSPYRAIALVVLLIALLKLVESNSGFFIEVNTCDSSKCIPIIKIALLHI